MPVPQANRSPGTDFIALPRGLIEAELLLASQMRTSSLVLRAYAHDARTPLNAMQLSVELLETILADADDAGVPGAKALWQRHIGVLREECGKLSRTLQALVEQQQPLRASAQIFDLRSVVHDVVGILRGQAARQRVRLTAEAPEWPVMMQGCRDRIKQGLLNMGVHALDKVPEGGRLRLELSADGGDHCTLSVEHDGTPTPPQDLTRVECLLADGKLAGLWAARLAAESHAGTLAFEQGPGQGGRIRMVLSCVPGSR